MPCRTISEGKKATYDGSTFVARCEDSTAGTFNPKKLVVVHPKDQPKVYQSVLSRVTIPLTDLPMRYTAVPNAVNSEGIWAAAGVNEANVSMTATETITSNARVLGADPLVKYVPASEEGQEKPGGIGEEDIVTLTLPYIRSAREGVLRLGMLLKTYGTYEMNGIAFQDVDEVWWLETIGGHHWIAKRVPDDAYVVMPNQFGIDSFDLADAYGEKKDHLCSEDLWEFIEKAHLDLFLKKNDREGTAGNRGDLFDARAAFGSHSDHDHLYNTPRAWFMQRYLNPHAEEWDRQDGRLHPHSDDIPWSRVPERKITVEDVKYLMSSHYQGTPYDPYARHGDNRFQGIYRPIGVNRNNFVSLVQLRPYRSAADMAVEWLGFGSNVFNAFVPVYANVDQVPDYYSVTGKEVSTESFYWTNRLLGALADASFSACIAGIEKYQLELEAKGHHWIAITDEEAADLPEEEIPAFLEKQNAGFARTVRQETQTILAKVLDETSNRMKNAYSRSDA